MSERHNKQATSRVPGGVSMEELHEEHQVRYLFP